ESVLLRQLLERRARVGDRREMPAGRSAAAVLVELVPEVREVRQRLGRLAGLRRDDEQRVLNADLRADAEDRGRVRRVENVKLRVGLGRPERVAQNVRAQARTAHSEK